MSGKGCVLPVVAHLHNYSHSNITIIEHLISFFFVCFYLMPGTLTCLSVRAATLSFAVSLCKAVLSVLLHHPVRWAQRQPPLHWMFSMQFDKSN